MKIGQTRIKLAAKLQATMPSITIEYSDGQKKTIPLLWKPDNLYPAQGSWRSNKTLDCCRWEGSVMGVRENGTTYVVTTVHSYDTMTALVNGGDLVIGENGEVSLSAEQPYTRNC